MSPAPLPTLRRYAPNDHSQVLALHELALRHAGAFIEESELDHDLDDIQYSYLQSGGEFLVVEVDGKVIGMGALRRTSQRTAEIKRMRVHPRWQRQGLGQALLDRLEDRARQLGCTRLQLDTTVQQTAAQALYRRAGYEEIGRRRLFDTEVVFMEKALARGPGRPARQG